MKKTVIEEEVKVKTRRKKNPFLRLLKMIFIIFVVLVVYGVACTEDDSDSDSSSSGSSSSKKVKLDPAVEKVRKAEYDYDDAFTYGELLEKYPYFIDYQWQVDSDADGRKIVKFLAELDPHEYYSFDYEQPTDKRAVENRYLTLLKIYSVDKESYKEFEKLQDARYDAQAIERSKSGDDGFYRSESLEDLFDWFSAIKKKGDDAFSGNKIQIEKSYLDAKRNDYDFLNLWESLQNQKADEYIERFRNYLYQNFYVPDPSKSYAAVEVVLRLTLDESEVELIDYKFYRQVADNQINMSQLVVRSGSSLTPIEKREELNFYVNN